MGTQKRSQEAGNDSIRKRASQREERSHRASMKEKEEHTTSRAAEDRKALDTTEERTREAYI